MNAAYLYSLIAVVLLGLIAYAGVAVAGLEGFFGIFIPYVAVIVFVVGFAKSIINWAQSPVPFRIPTTSGQQKSLSSIKHDRFDNPSNTFEVVGRMVLEVLLFRSLFKNTRVGFKDVGGYQKIYYKWVVWLWLFGILFHYAFLVTVIRHLRFFTEPVPFFVDMLSRVDGMMQVGAPGILLSGLVLLAAASVLLIRRIVLPKLKYISLAADYFPLLLIIGIAVTGILMRHFTKVDVAAVKELTMGLATLQPSIPAGGLSAMFYVHLFFVSLLLAYIPFSKLMHMGGVFMSPTRNLANNSRAARHVNPWNYDVKTHTYEEYEDDFREKMKEAGLPVEKE